MKLEFNNGHSTKWLFLSTISRLNWNFGVLVFVEGGIRRKTLRARMRTNNNLNPQVTQRSGIKPRPHWWEASTLFTAPSLQVILIVHYTFHIFWRHTLRQSTSFWGMQTEVAIYFCSRKQNLVKRKIYHLQWFWFDWFLIHKINQNKFLQTIMILILMIITVLLTKILFFSP